MTIAIYNKDHVLLKHSTVVEKEKYHWFKELLEEEDKITDEMVRSFDNKKRNFFENIVPELIQQAHKEWQYVSVENVEGQGVKCSICETRNLKHLFYIKNLINEKRLGVGSTCVKEFGYTDNINIEKAIEEADKTSRLLELTEKIPDIKKIISSWKDELYNISIILPSTFEQPYIDTYKATKRLYNNYIDGAGDVETIEEIKKLLKTKKYLFKKIKEFEKDKVPNFEIPSIDIAVWLEKTHNSRVLKNIKNNNGLIDEKIIPHIAEASYMELVKDELNFHLQKLNFTITKTLPDWNAYLLNTPKSKIKLIITHKTITTHFGCLIFNSKKVTPLTPENLAKLCRLNDSSSRHHSINILDNKLSKHNISIYNYDLDHNDIYFKKGSTYYHHFRLKYLLDQHIDIVLDIVTSDKLVKQIIKLKTENIDNIKYLLQERQNKAI